MDAPSASSFALAAPAALGSRLFQIGFARGFELSFFAAAEEVSNLRGAMVTWASTAAVAGGRAVELRGSNALHNPHASSHAWRPVEAMRSSESLHLI